MFVYLILLSLLCSSFSLSVVAAPTSQTGQAARGSRTRTTSGWFLIAAVKLPVTSAASGIIPPTSTRWRWVDWFIRLSRVLNYKIAKFIPFHFSYGQGGCIMKLEEFILSQLYILGAVGIGIAFLQVKPYISTCESG